MRADSLPIKSAAGFRQQLLEESADVVSKLVLRAKVSLDSVTVLATPALTRAQAGFLRNINPGGVLIDRTEANYERRYNLHQPDYGALESISNFDHLVSRLHVALDLYTSGNEEASQLLEYLRIRDRQLWHGMRQVNVVGTSQYASKDGRTNRNKILYIKEFKEENTLCVREEVKLGRAKTCQRYGIFYVEDIAGLDLHPILRREFVLSAFNLKKLDRTLEDLAGNHLGRPGVTRNSMKSRIETLIARSLGADSFCDVTQMPIQLCLEKFDFLRKCTVTVPLLEIIEKAEIEIQYKAL